MELPGAVVLWAGHRPSVGESSEVPVLKTLICRFPLRCTKSECQTGRPSPRCGHGAPAGLAVSLLCVPFNCGFSAHQVNAIGELSLRICTSTLKMFQILARTHIGKDPRVGIPLSFDGRYSS